MSTLINRLKVPIQNIGTGTYNSSNYLRGDLLFTSVTGGNVNLSQLENYFILSNFEQLLPVIINNIYIDSFVSTINIDVANSTGIYTTSYYSTSVDNVDISTSQVDCSGWYDISSATVTQTTPGDVTASIIYHVISFDNKVTWKVFKSSAWTSVVRNNSGTWQYSNAGSWTNASSNTQVQALIQATDQTAYQWTKTNIEAMVSGDWMAANGWSTDVNTLDWTTRLIDGTSVQPDGSQNAGTAYATSASSDYTTGSQIVTCSLVYTTYYGWKAFNQTISTTDYWRCLTINNIFPQAIMIDLGSGNEKVINKYAFYISNRAYNPGEWKLQGTNNTNATYSDLVDINNWITLHSVSSIACGTINTWMSYNTFSNSVAYRYYRVLLYSCCTLTAEITLGEIKLVAASTTTATPTFTKVTFTCKSFVNNLDVRSLGWEASVNDPTSAYCLLDIEPVDSITLDTDLKAWISINDGTNYEQITGLSIVGTNGTHNYVRGDISNITARTDKTIRLKVTSHNSKQLKLHNWSIGVKY